MDLISQFKSIYATPFKNVLIKEDESICLSIWQEENEFMSHDEYKHDAINMRNIILNNEFKSIITDNRNTRFKFNDELDLWYRENFFGPIMKKSKLARFAIVLNESLRLSVMVEELFDDISLEHKAFNSIEDAYVWVKRPLSKPGK